MKKIDFGMPALIEAPALRECVGLCKLLGLDFIELNMNMPQYQIGAVTARELLQHTKRDGVYFTIHLDENLNVWDFNSLVVEAYTHTVLWAVRLAREAKIPVLNMHMANGVYLTLPDRKIYLFNQYKDDYIRKTMAFRKSCEDAIGRSDIKICIENCGGYTDFTAHAIEILLESDIFALTMDIGHSHCAGNADEAFISKHIGKLRHVHVHDAKGKKNHLALGDGEIDIAGKLRLAKERRCRCVLETKTIDSLKKSVNNLKKYLPEE